VSDTNASAAEIERNLDQTRARLNRNLGTLEDRFSPNQMMEQAIAYLRTGQGAAFTRNLGVSVRENPLPAAITGIGLAWLMASNGRPSSTTTRTYHLHERAHQAGLSVTRLPHDTDVTHRDRMDDARAAVLGVRRRASETSDAFSTRIQDAMSAAREWAASTAGQVQDSANALGDQMSRHLHDARDSLHGAQGSAQDSVQYWAGSASGGASQMMSQGQRKSSEMLGALTDTPLLLGALAVTAGALIGILLPESSVENQYLGDAGDTVRGTVRDTAQDVMDRGQHAVQATMQAGLASAKEAGLAPDQATQSAADLTAKARHIAEAALSAGKDAVQNPKT
jgi:hypothetical protein